MRIAILGAGNWGTTMALLLQRAGHDVALWEFDAVQAAAVAETRRNEKFLPGFKLHPGILVTADIAAALMRATVCLLAVPAQTCRSVLRSLARLDAEPVIVSLVKGIERQSLARISQICAAELPGFTPERFAVISGPTIAPEVAAGLPTSAVIAATSAATAQRLQSAFSTPEFRLYTTDDVAGVELAGALKNVVALAAGISDGMQLGFNAKGSLLTRGLAEIVRLGSALGGSRPTFSGLSGMGDLVTTCTSPHSRNRTLGEAIGRGEPVAEALERMVMVAEGVWTARAARDLAERHRIEMPITDAVCRILDDGVDPRQAVRDLMQRNLKAED